VSDAVDLRELLTIDIAAELRKLTTAQLQGPWQLPAELVRRSLSAGARTVEVELQRSGLKVRDDGAPLDRDRLRALADLLDAAASPERRHRALLALEAAGALALLALPATDPGRVEVVARGGGLSRRLEFSRHGRCAMHEETDPHGGRGTTVTVQGAEIDLARARSFTSDACRFAPGVVRVDGEAASDGLRRYLAAREFALPQHLLTGHVALTHRGEQARIWVLVHGVVVTHVGVARSPCFEAIVELGDAIAGGRLPPTATAADLREAIAPALDELVDAGVRLMIVAAAEAAKLPATAQTRILHLLLQAVRARRRTQEVLAVPILPAWAGRGNRQLLPLAAIPAIARNEPAYVLGPEQNPDEFALPEGVTVLVLDTAERGVLADVLGARFRPPPPRGDGRVPVAARVRRGWQRFVHGLSPTGKPLPESAMSASERQFLAAVRAAVRGGAGAPERVELCAGRGSPRIAGQTLYLGREHPDVQAAVAAAAKGDAWLYPACVALFGGRGMPAIGARATWVRTWLDAIKR
jgi:hypothetical protein